jgi:hypothetical protein
MHQIRLGLAQIQQWPTKRFERAQHAFAILDRPCVARRDRDNVPADQVPRDARQVQGSALHHDGHQFVRAVGDPIAVETQNLRRLLHRPEHRSREDVRPQRVQPELEIRHKAEVAAATPHSPEKVGDSPWRLPSPTRHRQ